MGAGRAHVFLFSACSRYLLTSARLLMVSLSQSLASVMNWSPRWRFSASAAIRFSASERIFGLDTRLRNEPFDFVALFFSTFGTAPSAVACLSVEERRRTSGVGSYAARRTQSTSHLFVKSIHQDLADDVVSDGLLRKGWRKESFTSRTLPWSALASTQRPSGSSSTLAGGGFAAAVDVPIVPLVAADPKLVMKRAATRAFSSSDVRASGGGLLRPSTSSCQRSRKQSFSTRELPWAVLTAQHPDALDG